MSARRARRVRERWQNALRARPVLRLPLHAGTPRYAFLLIHVRSEKGVCRSQLADRDRQWRYVLAHRAGHHPCYGGPDGGCQLPACPDGQRHAFRRRYSPLIGKNRSRCRPDARSTTQKLGRALRSFRRWYLACKLFARCRCSPPRTTPAPSRWRLDSCFRTTGLRPAYRRRSWLRPGRGCCPSCARARARRRFRSCRPGRRYCENDETPYAGCRRSRRTPRLRGP